MHPRVGVHQKHFLVHGSKFISDLAVKLNGQFNVHPFMVVSLGPKRIEELRRGTPTDQKHRLHHWVHIVISTKISHSQLLKSAVSKFHAWPYIHSFSFFLIGIPQIQKEYSTSTISASWRSPLWKRKYLRSKPPLLRGMMMYIYYIHYLYILSYIYIISYNISPNPFDLKFIRSFTSSPGLPHLGFHWCACGIHWHNALGSPVQSGWIVWRPGGLTSGTVPSWWLVEPPSWKNMNQKWESSANFGVKTKNIWNHHPGLFDNRISFCWNYVECRLVLEILCYLTISW